MEGFSLSEWSGEYAQLLQNLVILIGALSLISKRLRAMVSGALKRFSEWISKDRIEFQNDIRNHIALQAEEKDRHAKKLEECSETVLKIKYALFNDEKNGIIHQVGKLYARDNLAFENARYPAFECDERGNNLRVTAAYRRLVNVSNADSLTGTKWHLCLHGSLKQTYLDEFDRCSLAREDFMAVVDFADPITGEHVGRWRIYAPCSVLGDSVIFHGRFIAAEDDKAKELTRSESWDVDV